MPVNVCLRVHMHLFWAFVWLACHNKTWCLLLVWHLNLYNSDCLVFDFVSLIILYLVLRCFKVKHFSLYLSLSLPPELNHILYIYDTMNRSFWTMFFYHLIKLYWHSYYTISSTSSFVCPVLFIVIGIFNVWNLLLECVWTFYHVTIICVSVQLYKCEGVISFVV